MFGTVQSIEARGRDEFLKRFVDARDLPPELQQETLEQLFRSASGDLRNRALRAGAILLADETLVGYLRDEADDVLRNAGQEMLKLRGRRSFTTMVGLLSDADGDVVLQAVLALDAIRDPRAWSHLRPLLQHEDQNVVQATIVAAGHLGGANAARDVVPFLSADPWLQVAAIQALGDLRSTSVVLHLRPLLSDPFLQPFVAEALARIGDATAFRALAKYWLTAGESEPQFYLELIAAMLAQFERPPRDEKLREVARRYLGSTDHATAAAAAWCVLVLGPSCGDGAVLDLIAATTKDLRCPISIAGRSDLAPDLIRREPPLRDWGYEILERFPTVLPAHRVAGAITESPPSHTGSIGAYLARSGDGVLALPLLSLWIGRPEEREPLQRAVRRHGRALLDLLVARSDIALSDRLTLLEATGGAPSAIAEEIANVEETARWEALGEIRTRAVVKRLPWAAWLNGIDREAAARALADAVSRTACGELLPLLRSELAARPQRELVQAIGDLRDADSVPILTALLQHSAPLLRAAIFDSFGRIGGANARAVLRSYCVADSSDVAQASRALAMCATEADSPLLRAAADSPDLSVRLAVIAPLSSFPGEEDRRVLRRLLFDPSSAVAQKAQSVLDLAWGAA